MREVDFEKLFQYIKQNIIEEEGIDRDDLDEEEDYVNYWAKAQFKEICGFEYDDLEE
jgi:hypothetical protein